MKKKIIKVSLLFFCVISIFNSMTFTVHAYDNKSICCLNAEESKEKLYEDLLSALLFQHIDYAIENYYGKPKQFTNPKILEIKRLEKDSYYFEATIQVETFDGLKKSNPSTDVITIRNDDGDIEVTKFEHKDTVIKS